MRNDPIIMAPVAPSRVTGAVARGRGQWVQIVLTLLSFSIYAGALFSLPQDRDLAFAVDRSSLAAAVSNTVYDAPFGAVFSGVLEHLLRHTDAPLQKVFDEIARGEAPAGHVMPTIRDGNGIGYVVVATMALRLFGLHSWSLPLLMLVIMGFSGLALVVRFGSDIADIVILYFCTLTVMLFTALVWNSAYSFQISVGGSRYFTLVAILPAFHLLFEIIERPSGEPRGGRRNEFMLGAQTMIFVLSVLVRGSAAATAGAVGLVWFVLLWRRRHAEAERRLLKHRAVIITLGSVGFIGVIILLLPLKYITEGRFTKTFWELTIIGLGANPAWPFADLREIFDCRQHIPEGLVSGLIDRNAHCIWWDYVTKHRIPANEVVTGAFGGRYETAMREGFFKITQHYPGEVLMTIFYYKPKMIISSIFSSIQMRLMNHPWFANGLLAAALVNSLTYFIVAAPLPGRNRVLISKAALLFAVSTLPSYLVAWAHPWTVGDLLFYCIFCGGLLSGVVVAMGSSAIKRLARDRSRGQLKRRAVPLAVTALVVLPPSRSGPEN